MHIYIIIYIYVHATIAFGLVHKKSRRLGKGAGAECNEKYVHSIIVNHILYRLYT
jgi:hypothetical protein